MWSGEPNPQLVAEVADLPAGEALDLGCGEGADAIWLAARGWSVTGLDVSAVALERAAAHARERGQDATIEWVQQDLATWVPDRLFDLVTAQFLHSTQMPWQQALQLAAAAVRTGGTLLIVGHHPDGLPPWGAHHTSGEVLHRRGPCPGAPDRGAAVACRGPGQPASQRRRARRRGSVPHGCRAAGHAPGRPVDGSTACRAIVWMACGAAASGGPGMSRTACDAAHSDSTVRISVRGPSYPMTAPQSVFLNRSGAMP